MTLYISKINNANTNVSFQYFGGEHMWGLLVSATYSFNLKDVTGEDGDDKLQVGIEAIENARSFFSCVLEMFQIEYIVALRPFRIVY